MKPRVLDGLGLARWPSLVLITVVPAWFYMSGWDGGFGSARTAVATVELEGASYRLWRSKPAGGLRTWCAQPLGEARTTGELDMVQGALAVPATFDAGLYCAELPAAPGHPQLVLRRAGGPSGVGAGG